MGKLSKSKKAKVIFNPHAGSKKRILSRLEGSTTLEDIKELLEQYQIPADFYPTKSAGHAQRLAREAIKEGYRKVLVAGGDGTVGEAANGLVGTDMTLGILPLGSVMNVCRMLAIPNDLEKAVELIKIGETKKIDVGCVSRLSGQKLEDPYYFIESAGMGLEAEMQESILRFEKGDFWAIFKVIKILFEYFHHRAKIILDDKKTIQTRATLITISNGPYSGASIPLAPKAKLNDHKLTVSIFRMSKFELFRFIIKAIRKGKASSSKIAVYQANKVKILTKTKRLVHADARIFGETPVSFKVIPKALKMIVGFPKPGQSALIEKTYLSP